MVTTNWSFSSVGYALYAQSYWPRSKCSQMRCPSSGYFLGSWVVAWLSLGLLSVSFKLPWVQHHCCGLLNGLYTMLLRLDYPRIVQYLQDRLSEIESSYWSCCVGGRNLNCPVQNWRCCSVSRDPLCSCAGIHLPPRSHVDHSKEDQWLSNDFQYGQILALSQMVSGSFQCFQHL